MTEDNALRIHLHLSSITRIQMHAVNGTQQNGTSRVFKIWRVSN